MQTYLDLHGDSNVSKYSIEADSIEVEFKDSSAYLYTYQSAGMTHIENMKQLAIQGYGLNSYINVYVRKKYSRKLR